MRVALVCDWFLPRVGGIELHLRDLALALRRSGVDARVVTTTRGPDLVEGVPVHRVRAPLAPAGSFAFTPAALRGLRDVLRSEQVDVVHAHASVVSPLAYGGALAGARDGRATLLTFHSMLHRSAFLLGASEALFHWATGRVVMTGVSSVVAAQAARWIPNAAVGVLPNGIDAEFWRPHHDAPAGDGEIVFVSAMRLSRKKRPSRLLRAFADASRFVAGAPAMRLVIGGDGPDRAALRRYADELSIGARVELIGHQSREALRTLYARAHAFVLPSERESFGIAALEARTAGLPIIAMLASGVRDFVRQGSDGLLARDAAELSRFIARLALDAPLRDFMARHNRTTPPPYDWSDVAELHHHYYDAAMALRDSAARVSHR
ncbi:MAG TPA: glycosyltransferase family 4 protein [Gemmatimonadaceae bacterium]